MLRLAELRVGMPIAFDYRCNDGKIREQVGFLLPSDKDDPLSPPVGICRTEQRSQRTNARYERFIRAQVLWGRGIRKTYKNRSFDLPHIVGSIRKG